MGIQKKLAEDEGEEKPKSEEQTNETVQKSEEPTKIPKNFMEVVMDSMIQKSLIEETENKPTETTTQELLVGFGEDTSLEVFQEQEVKAVSSIKQGVSYSSSGYHVSGDDVNKELKDPKLDEVEVPLEDIIPEPEIQKIEPEPTENFTSQAHHERIREEENLEEEEPDFDEVEYVVDEEDLRDRTWAEPIIEAPASLKNTLVLPAGEVLELVAAFDGNPMPSLLWKFNDVIISPRTMPHIVMSTRGPDIALLTIDCVEEEDTGIYTLIAENEAGQAVQNFKVEVIDMEREEYEA